MPWALRRKLLYTLVAVIFITGAAVWGGMKLFYRPATCTDGTQNGHETGVDCGGDCVIVCKGDARAPVVLWKRVLPTGKSEYTAAAYIQNPNVAADIGAYGVRYSFRLLDDNNLLIAERDGVVDIPPQQEIPIIEPNILVGERHVAHIFFDFSGDITWSKIPQALMPTLGIENQSMSTENHSLTATISNRGVKEVRGLTVAAVLTDEDNIVQAVSRSTLSKIPASGSQDVIFTWNNEISSAVRAKLILIPALPSQSSL